MQLKVPLEIVPNTISKRKTELAVAFDRGERMVGNDAFGMLSRKPQFSFTHFREMLGRSLEHPLVEGTKALKYGTVPFYNETHGGIAYKLDDQNTFTAEELTAMMFTYARDTTKDFGGQAVRDCVITVPSYATAHERRALMSAAEIAGLKVLALIEENTAAALQYGKDNVFEDKTVLYYNMGASSTQVLIANYHNYTIKELGKNKTIGSFEVKAKSWDSKLGGEQFDIVLMNHFAEKFNEQWGAATKGDDVRTKIRPMAKLRAQATKTKHVLSANTEIPVKVNSLHDDADLSFLMTRQAFEDMAAPLFARVTAPIEEALAFANMTLADLDAVELIGGGQRIPKIQSILSEFFGDQPLGVHLNADEAPALGAAFEAANLSTAFKVRKTGMTDYSHFPVEVKLRSIATEEGGGILEGLFGGAKKDSAEEQEAMEWKKQTVVFDAWSKLDKSKKIAFHHNRDINCELNYVSPGEESVPLPTGTATFLRSFNITGIAKFAKEQAEKGTCGGNEKGMPKVHLTFKLDAGGIVRLAKAEATCEEPKAVENATDTNTTDAEAPTEVNEEKNGSEEVDPVNLNETQANETEGTETTEKKKGKKEKSAKEKKTKKERKKDAVQTVNLLVDEQYTDPAVLSISPSEMQSSKDKLAYLQVLADLRTAKLEAKNTLEAYLYEIKNRVEDEAETVDQVTTEEQREEILNTVRNYADWLDDDGYDVETEIYITKRKEVKALADPIFFRASELVDRPKAVKSMSGKIEKIKQLVEKWITDMPHITETERKEVIDRADEGMKWLDEKVAAQKDLDMSVEPAFTSSEVYSELDSVGKVVTRLARKPKPKPKPILNVTNATNTTDSSNSTNTTEDTHGFDTVEGGDEGVTEGEDKEGETVDETDKDSNAGGPDSDEL